MMYIEFVDSIDYSDFENKTVGKIIEKLQNYPLDAWFQVDYDEYSDCADTMSIWASKENE